MQSEARHRAILDRLRATGRIDVLETAEQLEISPITIRRDLEQLAAVGALRRVRGGAVSSAPAGEGLPFALRAGEGQEHKARLAAAAVGLIADGEAVIVDSGTTGAAAAAELAHRRVTAMPLSIQGIAALSAGRNAAVLLPGGSVRRPEGSLVGAAVERTLSQLRFDTVVLTCCAASADFGVMAFDLDDAAVKQAARRAAARTILIAEGPKFGLTALAKVCRLQEVDVLVTDQAAPSAVLDQLREDGVAVEVV
jgi:DeoR/GlpR family transcriptional regulator of sugar metabolism